jgi:hypothetical protein
MDLGFRGVIVDFPSTMPRAAASTVAPQETASVRPGSSVSASPRRGSRRCSSRGSRTPGPSRASSASTCPRWRRCSPSSAGEAPLLIEVNHAQDILDAIEWVQERGVRAVLMGVVDGWRVADRLAASGIPVITGPVHAIPLRESDRYDLPYANAGIMHQAGVQVALRTTSLGMNDTHNTRNLPFHAAFAAAYGEPYGFGPQQALEAVTIVPARIFGLEGEIGSIEVGEARDAVRRQRGPSSRRPRS